MSAAERQIREIEVRLAGSRQEPGANASAMRARSRCLRKTMQSLTALDALHEPKAGQTETEAVGRR